MARTSVCRLNVARHYLVHWSCTDNRAKFYGDIVSSQGWYCFLVSDVSSILHERLNFATQCNRHKTVTSSRVQNSCDAIWRVALKCFLRQPCRFKLRATIFWQILVAFRKKRQFHIYRLHKEIVIKSSIVCLRNEANVKQTTDIRHLATVFVVIVELASIL